VLQRIIIIHPFSDRWHFLKFRFAEIETLVPSVSKNETYAPFFVFLQDAAIEQPIILFSLTETTRDVIEVGRDVAL